jgi:hypothetical protein
MKKTIFLLIGILLFLGISTIVLINIHNSNKPKPTIEIVGCKKAGCSNILCIDSNAKDTITTCEWKDEYSCYQSAKCERQADGKCGFTKDQEFQDCLNKLIPKFEKIPKN